MKPAPALLHHSFKGIALACAVAVLVSGSHAHGQPLRKVNLATQGGMAPLYIAVKEKYFERLGLDVNLVKFTSGPSQFAALAGGQIDLAWGGIGTFSIAKANGQDLHFVAPLLNFNAAQALLVPAKSPVKSVSDLTGRKVALVLGSDAHYGTLRTLRRHGVDLRTVTVLGMAPPQQIAALLSGDVDAIYTWQPFITPVIEKGGRVLSLLQELDPGSSYVGYAGKRAWLEANADVVVRVLKGWNLGLAKLKADPELGIRLTREFTGMTEAQARALAKDLGVYDATAALDPASDVYWAKDSRLCVMLRDFQAFGREAGVIKKEISLDDYLMTRFMQAVKDGK